MPNTAKINIYALTFDLELRHADIQAFRGAFAAMAGRQNDLFHNHDNEEGSSANYKHRYPLVQYRIHGGNASVYGINEGADALEKLQKSGILSDFSMNGDEFPLQVIHSNRERGLELEVTEQVHAYRIYRYLPFSPDKYREYKNMFALREKIVLLERLIQNHIVSFAHGTNWVLPPDRRIAVTINDLDRVKKVKVVGRDLMAFDLVFSVNARLPEGLGLGRKTAFGFGFVVPTEHLK
jgi:hypothetical protein